MSAADRFEHVDWKQAGVFGAGAWIGGLVLSYVLVTVSGLMDEAFTTESTFDVAVWAFYDSLQGVFEDDLSILTVGYEQIDTRFWVAGIFVHYVLPAILLIVAGYILAGRYRSGAVEGPPRTDSSDVLVGGASLGVVFGALTVVAMTLFADDPFTVDFLHLVVVGFAYPVVFAGIGASMHTSIRGVFSGMGFLGGIAAFVLGFGLWYVIDDAEEFADPDGLSENLMFAWSYYFETHAFEYDQFIPEWYVVLALAAVGAGLVYRADITDRLAGARRGARIGTGYALVAAIVAIVASVVTIEEAVDAGADDWDILYDSANAILSAIPPTIVAAIVWAGVFGAVGGAIGAAIVESQREDESSGSREPPEQAAQAEHSNE